VIVVEAVPVRGAAGAPEVRLLHACASGLELRALRACARAETDASEAPYVSRSYSHPYALVAWHSAPVGVDIARIEPCELAFVNSICTPSELSGLCDVTDLDRHAAVLWCSKEALSKALGDAVDYDPRRLDAPTCWPGGRSGPWRARPLAIAATRHVGWLCWQSDED
jgi:hypothetical protein